MTADIPAERTARPLRDPWRATKTDWTAVYALILPGVVTVIALPGGPAPTTAREVVTYFAVSYAIFWIVGVCVTVASRRAERSGGQPPPRSVPGTEIEAQAVRTLKAALEQGRLTEEEYDERLSQASASRSRAELAALTADLPVGQLDAPARPPLASDVWIGVGAIVAAASVVAAVLVWRPDNGLAFMTFCLAALTLLVTPIVTVGMMVDVRRQKQSGRDGDVRRAGCGCLRRRGRCRRGCRRP